MLKIPTNIFNTETVTQKDLFSDRSKGCLGLPQIRDNASCTGDNCNQCVELCPVDAISISDVEEKVVSLDLGKCIACGLCVNNCPDGIFENNLSTKTVRVNRAGLILSTGSNKGKHPSEKRSSKDIFKRSIGIRVVSTGCTACDLEVSAAFNPIFDLERFGVQLVASPRMADALVVTGPVGKGMQQALLRTYEAMPEPKLVVAAGTCAISGGVHRGGYTEANGVDAIIPVDVYIPGCPPHPWSIIHGILVAMGKVEPV